MVAQEKDEEEGEARKVISGSTAGLKEKTFGIFGSSLHPWYSPRPFCSWALAEGTQHAGDKGGYTTNNRLYFRVHHNSHISSPLLKRSAEKDATMVLR